MPNVARRRMRYLLGGRGSVVLPSAGFLIQEHCCGVLLLLLFRVFCSYFFRSDTLLCGFFVVE